MLRRARRSTIMSRRNSKAHKQPAGARKLGPAISPLHASDPCRTLRQFALSTDVRNWTPFVIENWTSGSSFCCRILGAGWLVQVAHRRDPRAGEATAPSLAERRVGGPYAPIWASLVTPMLPRRRRARGL